MRRILLALGAALALLGPAAADTVAQVNMTPRVVVLNPDGTIASFTSGGGGTVTQGPPGTSPWPAVVAQYNSTLPTLTSGAPAYLAVDSNGRLIQSPGASVSVSNFPASQAVTNAGTFAVQNTAAVVGGNTTPVKTDGSATTQPVSAAALPLPAGAATAANQTATQSAPGTSATTADTIQGSATGVPIRVAASQWWTEAGAASAAASANISYTSRSSGGASGGVSPFAYFQVIAASTSTGTLNAICGGVAQSAAVASTGVPTTIKILAFSGTCNSSFINGGTAGTVSVYDGFTVN